ncbi:TniB family NTP-binding protein [Ahrensia sp. 13_GOM-1096m]|uniref:TniB family NTP-binding protein n=1 Tax=Ahrensia sp. 13_GOM-1096m TaxID=1380380 RepID=UPI00047C7CC3|nr:TniB family NTP-binding protein [Ahrensia sp. 13_GOM-1096m]
MNNTISVAPKKRFQYSPEQLRRIEMLKTKTVMTRYVTEGRDWLYEVYANAKLGREAELYRIIGPAGVSKSTTIAKFISENPRFEDRFDENNRILNVPVLKIEVPPGVGKNGLYVEILSQLGWSFAQIPRSGDAIRGAARKALKIHRVKMLVIDEAQNLVFSRTEKAIITAHEVLRALINENSCQIVLVGVEELASVANCDGSKAVQAVERQLERRLMGTLYMHPYHANNGADFQEFSKIIKALERVVFDQPELSNLSQYTEEFFEATNGILADLVKLLTIAVKLAFKEGREYVTKNDLLYAYAERLGGNKANPFGVPAYAAKIINSSRNSHDDLSDLTSLWGEKRVPSSDFSK